MGVGFLWNDVTMQRFAFMSHSGESLNPNLFLGVACPVFVGGSLFPADSENVQAVNAFCSLYEGP